MHCIELADAGENACPIARAILVRYDSRIKGDVYYVVTLISQTPYDRPVAQLDELQRAAESFAAQLK